MTTMGVGVRSHRRDDVGGLRPHCWRLSAEGSSQATKTRFAPRDLTDPDLEVGDLEARTSTLTLTTPFHAPLTLPVWATGSSM